MSIINRGFTTKTRQQRGVRSENQTVLPPRNLKKENEYIQSQNFSNKTSHQNQVAEMEREINNLNIQVSRTKVCVYKLEVSKKSL